MGTALYPPLAFLVPPGGGGSRLEFVPAMGLALTADGLRWMWTGCGATDHFLLGPGNASDFWLAPPDG